MGHLKGSRLVKQLRFFRLANADDDRVGAVEDRVAGALVGLPLRDKGRQAVVEELLVDFDLIVGHGGDVTGER